MLSVSRRVASAILALAVTAVPATALHARPAGVEGEATSWTATVLDHLVELFGLDGRDGAAATPTAVAAPSGGGTTTSSPAEPALVPDDGMNALRLQPSGDCRPTWDPNG